jgi:hypothetical protein
MMAMSFLSALVETMVLMQVTCTPMIGTTYKDDKGGL